VRFSQLLPQVWVRLAVVTSGCSRISSSDDGLIVVCSASRDECAVGQPMAARLLLTKPGWPTDCTCRGRRNQQLSATVGVVVVGVVVAVVVVIHSMPRCFAPLDSSAISALSALR
jgi:hypothetical protein